MKGYETPPPLQTPKSKVQTERENLFPYFSRWKGSLFSAPKQDPNTNSSNPPPPPPPLFKSLNLMISLSKSLPPTTSLISTTSNNPTITMSTNQTRSPLRQEPRMPAIRRDSALSTAARRPSLWSSCETSIHTQQPRPPNPHPHRPLLRQQIGLLQPQPRGALQQDLSATC
ncbi:extensin-like [Pyrus ussuriensis x Pyrus communis]|uniref:Extensin-like n=1 Tax=Pyrus ussuriensis x Pyrus communis TaxID=2448454 RepID=A0A5N5F8S9_9ROSA|nr:extensin-like [Pyrus ussuriensis x Pyrus communis]